LLDVHCDVMLNGAQRLPQRILHDLPSHRNGHQANEDESHATNAPIARAADAP